MTLNIAIAGAGIGGLAAAALLARDGHRVTVLDRFMAPRPLGSGLVIQPVGLAVLDDLGLAEVARDLSAPIRRMLGVDAQNNRKALDVRYPATAPGRAFHRASLFHLLWHAALDAGAATITGADVTAAPVAGQGRDLLLADGRRFGSFDLVIDALGAGSALSPLIARPLPYGALWTSIAWPDAAPPNDHLSQRYRAARQMAGILPIGRLPYDATPMAALFWSLPVDQIGQWHSTPLDDWKSEALSLWPDLAPFLERITDPAQMIPARYGHGSLRRPFAPALAHIGDAAHRASPQLGQGANMALLDAFALATALRAGPVSDALPDYARMRRWHMRMYQGLSAIFTPLYQSGRRGLAPIRNRILAPSSTLPLVRPLLTRLVAGTLIPPLAGASLDRTA